MGSQVRRCGDFAPRLKSCRGHRAGGSIVAVAFDPLKEQPAHADDLVVEGGFQGRGPGLAQIGERSGDERLAVDR